MKRCGNEAACNFGKIEQIIMNHILKGFVEALEGGWEELIKVTDIALRMATKSFIV